MKWFFIWKSVATSHSTTFPTMQLKYHATCIPYQLWLSSLGSSSSQIRLNTQRPQMFSCTFSGCRRWGAASRLVESQPAVVGVFHVTAAAPVTTPAMAADTASPPRQEMPRGHGGWPLWYQTHIGAAAAGARCPSPAVSSVSERSAASLFQSQACNRSPSARRRSFL